MSMVVDNQHHRRPSESSPSEMNESDHRLLLLASVSQSKREQSLRSVTEEHDSLAAHLSAGSPFMSYDDFVNSATAVSKNMTGYDVTVRHLPQPVVSHPTPSESVVRRPLFNPPAPQLLEHYRGCHQYNSSMGGAAASMQMRHNNYHQQLMSMSMGGLSPSTLKLLRQGVPPPQQMQKMQPMPKARKQKRTATSQEDEGPLNKKTKKVNDDSRDSQSPPPPQVPLVKKDDKKKPIVVFPNQEIYSQMLQIKALSNKPGPLHIHFKQGTLLSKERLTLSSSSPSSSGESSHTFFHQDQEQALNIQSKFLQMEMKRNEGQRERRTRQLLLEEERRRQFENLSVTLAETKKMGQLVDDYPPVFDSRMGMPLGGNVAQLNSSMGVPQDDPYFHALFLQSNQFGVSRLHQYGVDGRIVNGLNVDELGRRFMV